MNGMAYRAILGEEIVVSINGVTSYVWSRNS